MKKSILVDIISYFFILLFIYTGVAKFSEIATFREQMASSPLLGSLANILVWALPIGELILAVGLFVPRTNLLALYATLALMSLFTIYVTVIFFIDNHLSCSCGGIIEELSPRQHILFNCACVILALLGIVIRRKQQPTTRFKWLAGSSSIGLFLLIGWTLFTAFTAPITIKTGMEGRMIPSFELLLPDSTTHLNTADIPAGKPIIVIGFQPWCTHCQAETRDIIKNIQKFKDIQIYYVTPYPFNQMKTFYRAFKLSQYPNIIMGQDAKNTFMNYFKARGVPYIAIFDSKKRLLQAINSQFDAQRLAKLAAE